MKQNPKVERHLMQTKGHWKREEPGQSPAGHTPREARSLAGKPQKHALFHQGWKKHMPVGPTRHNSKTQMM